jgi:hypothetical protein
MLAETERQVLEQPHPSEARMGHQPFIIGPMPNDPHSVFVVLDGEYGTRLSELIVKGPIWIVDTPTNRAAAEIFWAAYPDRKHPDGVTVFKSMNVGSPETILLANLYTIDLHHNAYSADPPYTVLEVIGTSLSEKIKTELSEYGFDKSLTTSEGFRAERPLSAAESIV